jgi:hypothetical protein
VSVGSSLSDKGSNRVLLPAVVSRCDGGNVGVGAVHSLSKAYIAESVYMLDRGVVALYFFVFAFPSSNILLTRERT